MLRHAIIIIITRWILKRLRRLQQNSCCPQNSRQTLATKTKTKTLFKFARENILGFITHMHMTGFPKWYLIICFEWSSKAKPIWNRQQLLYYHAGFKTSASLVIKASHHKLIHNTLRTAAQNLHWKFGQLTPSFGSLLAYLETTVKKKFFFRTKTFLFFKIESWNFQHLSEIKFRETSQNFNSFRKLLF